jgi:hypothetical protein
MPRLWDCYVIRASADTLRNVRATLAAVNAHYPVKGDGYLLTYESAKLAKGNRERGYLPVILYAAPATSSGANLCAWSTAECRYGCLNTSGYGGINLDASGWNATQAARIRRAALMILDPEGFAAQLIREVKAASRKAEREGLRLAVRMNGTTDVAWHRVASELVAVIQEYATVYEYTKRPKPDALEAGIDITYSYPGGDGVAARRFLQAGARVAVVFDTAKGDALPATWRAPWGDTIPVIDGDAHEMRFTDPRGVIVGLRAKGRLVGERGTSRGFLQPA